MSARRNVYANLLERAYVVIDHLKQWNETFYTPIKG